MADDDLDNWLKALRGTPAADAGVRETARAEAIRQYFLRRIAEDGEAAPEDATRRDRLLAYMRRQEAAPVGLPRAHPVIVGPPGRCKASNARWYALAASIVFAVALLLINLLPQPGDTGMEANEGLQLRGTPIQTVRTASPSGTALEIERRLASLGVTVRREGFEAETVTLSAHIPAGQIGEARRFLEEFGIKVGDDGRMKVMLLP